MSFRIFSLTRNRQVNKNKTLQFMFLRGNLKVLYGDNLVSFLWNGFENQPIFILKENDTHVSGNIKIDTNAHEELFSEYNLTKDVEYYFSENLQKNDEFNISNNNNLVTTELNIISPSTNLGIKYKQTFNAHDNFMMYNFSKEYYDLVN